MKNKISYLLSSVEMKKRLAFCIILLLIAVPVYALPEGLLKFTGLKYPGQLADTTEALGNEVLLKGQLVSEKCVAKGMLSACYLEWVNNGPLVLFTGDRKLYKIEPNRVDQWKLDSGYGYQVVVKGILKGNKILVNDAAALGGRQKMSKACL